MGLKGLRLNFRPLARLLLGCLRLVRCWWARVADASEVVVEAEQLVVRAAIAWAGSIPSGGCARNGLGFDARRLGQVAGELVREREHVRGRQRVAEWRGDEVSVAVRGWWVNLSAGRM
jgi:hypothetical protein